VKVAAVILAAGRSSRFEDGHKLLAEIDGIPIVRRVASTIAQSRADDIILVTGANGHAVLAAAGTGRWRSVENSNAADGLSSSLSLAVQSLDTTAYGILVALADMPGISTKLVDALLATFTQSGGDSIVFPVASDGRRGHPVIWPRALFPALQNLSGDTGGKSLLAEHRELWLPVTCDDAGAFADIDTRADLDAFPARPAK
jgi:molybdenum cofactor cytidylyltransferase